MKPFYKVGVLAVGLVALSMLLGRLATTAPTSPTGSVPEDASAGATVFQVFQGGTGSTSYASNFIIKGGSVLQKSGVSIDSLNNITGITNASISSNLEVSTTASASSIMGAGLSDCSTVTKVLRWATTGKFSCATIVDADIPDTITATNYVLKAGDTMTGDLFGTNASESGNLEITGTSILGGEGGLYATSVGAGNGTLGFNSGATVGGVNYAAGVTGAGFLMQYTNNDSTTRFYNESSVTARSGHAHTTVLTINPGSQGASFSVPVEVAGLASVSSLHLGTLTGILKGTTGTIGTATAGSDYENPLTFSYPLSRSVNAISFPNYQGWNIPWVTIGNTSSLSFERALTGTANQLTVTDGGANGAVTLSIPTPFIMPGRASVSGNFEALGTASISSNFTANGTGSSSFAGSLNLSKGMTATSWQGGGLTACSTSGKVIRYNGGQYSCGTLTTSDIDYSAVFQPLDSTLTAFAAYNTNGLLTQTAADTFTGRTLTGTTNQITVTNGDGVSGNPTLSIPIPFIMPGRASASGNFEVLGTASVSSNFTVNGTGSSSFAGSLNLTKGFTAASYQGAGLTNCNTAATSKLLYSSGQFSCGTDQNAFTGLAMHEGTATAIHATDLKFDAGAFTFSNVASNGTLFLDYTNGPASRSIAQTISGLWTFSGGASIASNFEQKSGTASISNAFWTNGANVGIGNSTPDQKLDVSGNITASTSGNVDLVFNSSTNNDSKFTIRDVGASARLDILGSASQNFVSITSAGWQGIGNIAPIAPLDVRRSVTATTGGAYRGIYSSIGLTGGSGGFVYGIYGEAHDTTAWTPTSQYGPTGVTGEGNGVASSSRVWGGSFLATQSGNRGSDLTGIEVDVSAVASVARRYGVQIVGIAAGVASGSEIDSALRMTNKSGGAPWNDGILFDGSGSGVAYPVRKGGTLLRSNGIATVTSGIDLGTGLTVTGNSLALPNSFVVTGAGNQGIGTTAPLTKLEVQGTASASNLLTTGSLQVNGGASVSYNRVGTATTTQGLSSANDVLITNQLEVDGRVYFDGLAVFYGAQELLGNVNVAGNPRSMEFLNGTSAQGEGFWFFNSANHRNLMFMAQSGNIGIGTTAPTAALDILPSVSYSGPLFRVASGSNERFKVYSNGNASVSGNFEATYPTAGVTEDASCVATGGTLSRNVGATTCLVSSKKYKHDIKKLTVGLEEVTKLHPVSFIGNGDLRESIGFIAEDVEKVEPRLVFYEPGTKDPRGVKYEEMNALLVKAIQELKAKNDALETQVARLEGKAPIDQIVGSASPGESEWERMTIWGVIKLWFRIVINTFK